MAAYLDPTGQYWEEEQEEEEERLLPECSPKC